MKVGAAPPLPFAGKSRAGGLLMQYKPGEHSYSNPAGTLTALQSPKGPSPDGSADPSPPAPNKQG